MRTLRMASLGLLVIAGLAGCASMPYDPNITLHNYLTYSTILNNARASQRQPAVTCTVVGATTMCY